MTIDELIQELEDLSLEFGGATEVVLQSGVAGRKTLYGDFVLRPVQITDSYNGGYISEKSEDSHTAITFDLILPF